MGEPKEKLYFRDETGRTWTAFEAGLNDEKCLVFDTIDTFRRVRHYPDNWREMTPDELLALSWKQ